MSKKILMSVRELQKRIFGTNFIYDKKEKEVTKILKEKRKRVVFSMVAYTLLSLIALYFSLFNMIFDVLQLKDLSIMFLIGACISLLFFAFFCLMAMKSLFYEKDVIKGDRLGRMYQASLQGMVYEAKETIGINGKTFFLTEVQSQANSERVTSEISKDLNETEKIRLGFEKVYNFLKLFSFSF